MEDTPRSAEELGWARCPICDATVALSVMGQHIDSGCKKFAGAGARRRSSRGRAPAAEAPAPAPSPRRSPRRSTRGRALAPSSPPPAPSEAPAAPPPSPPPQQRPAFPPLQIGASQVGACVGVHPYADVDELWHGLIYQGAAGAALERADADALGASLETRDEAVARILRNASAETRRTVATARLAGRSGATSTRDIKKAEMLVAAAADAAVSRGECSKEEAAELANHERKACYTRFGTAFERSALDAYERATGRAAVADERRLEWRFYRDGGDAVVLDAKRHAAVEKRVDAFVASDAPELCLELSPAERRAAHRRAEAYPGLQHASEGRGADRRLMLRKPRSGWFVDGGAGPLNDEEARLLSPTARVRRTRFCGLPCACVSNEAYETLALVKERGAACSCEACPVKKLLGHHEEENIYEEEHASNGRKEERALPTRGGSNDELFRVVGYVDAVSPENDDSIVIEVKNRMHQVRAPELYDKLQVVTYLQMLGWSRGDLVQRIKSDENAPVRVDRILRSEHENDWARVVLPRLRAVAEAVLSLRADDSRRRAWLAASTYERKTTAAALCEFLPVPPEPVDDDADFWASAEAATQQAEEDAFWRQAAEAADAAAAAEQRSRRRSVRVDSVASRLLKRRRRRAAAVDSVAARAKRRRRAGGA